MIQAKATKLQSQSAGDALYHRLGRGGRGLVLGAIILLLPGIDAQAGLIDPSVQITASVDLDPLSQAVTDNATQSGTFTRVLGGATTTATVNNSLIVTGTLPLGGLLTDTGDGVGMRFTTSSTGVGTTNLFGDYAFQLKNTSLTDTFKITLEAVFDNQVDANPPPPAVPVPGTGAFTRGEMTLQNNANPGVDIFFTDLVSDNFFGDKQSGVLTGTFGDALSDNGITPLIFTLLPGATVNLSGEHNLTGGADPGNDYSSLLDGFIRVAAVENQTTPPITAPEPGTLVLAATGLLGLTLARRRQTCYSATS